MSISAHDLILKRIERYQLKNKVARWLRPTRTYYCRRCRTALPVSLLYSISRERATLGNLFSCGLGWTCPICGEKISERMAAEIDEAMTKHFAKGYHALHMTLTIPHHSGQSANDVLGNFQASRQLLLHRTAYKTLARDIGLIGDICAKDYTWGEASGHHLHAHDALLHTKPVNLDEVQDRITVQWQAVARTLNLPLPSDDYGVKITPAYRAGDYLCKWGTGRELTKGNSKIGKGDGRHSVHDLIRFDREAPFREYAAAFAGKKHVVWSKGLRDLYEIGKEETGQEICDKPDSDALTCGEFTDDQFDKFKDCHQPALLEAVEKACKLAKETGADVKESAWAAALNFISSLG